MLESLFNAGEVFFFANGGKIEKHTCMGSFEAEGKMNYVITPYGKLATVASVSAFKTFDEAKTYIVEAAEEVVKNAEKQVETIKSFSEDNVAEYSSEAPTEKEMVADEEKIAEESKKA